MFLLTITLSLFIFIGPLFGSGIETTTIHNELPDLFTLSDIDNSLTLLRNPISKAEKLFLYGDMLTGDAFLDKGMLQAMLLKNYHEDNNEINRTKISEYLLYKTVKYALQTFKLLLPVIGKGTMYRGNTLHNMLFKIQSYTGYRFFSDQIRRKDFLLHSYNKAYRQLQWFWQDDNRKFFTPLVMFNCLFQFAFLNDVAHFHRFNYFSCAWQGVMEFYAQWTIEQDTDLSSSLFKDEANRLNQKFIRILDSYRELNTGSVNFEKLKKWYGDKDFFIFPIVNKKGIIGINTFDYIITQGYCLVGFGYVKSTVHANTYHSITDSSFHDLLHGRLPLKQEMNGLTPSHERLFFMKNAHLLVENLIPRYRQAYKAKDTATYQQLLKPLVALFIVLHEREPNAGSYENVLPEKNTIGNSIINLLKFEIIEDGNDHEPVPQSKLKETMFNTIDLFYILRKIFPDLLEKIKGKNLKIQSYTLRTKTKSAVTYQELRFFLKHIQYYIAYLWKDFVSTYGLQFGSTLPYTVDDLTLLQKGLLE